MKPVKVSFYIYANSDEQVQALQAALNDFIREKYNQGVIVTAEKFAKAIKSFGNNYFVTNYLK